MILYLSKSNTTDAFRLWSKVPTAAYSSDMKLIYFPETRDNIALSGAMYNFDDVFPKLWPVSKSAGYLELDVEEIDDGYIIRRIK